MDKTFGLITEGPTDQVVIRYLLGRYFSNADIDTRPIQPNSDANDKAGPGGWHRVLEYCISPDMGYSLKGYDFVIIQIDTDCCEDYGIKKREGSVDLPGDEIIQKTKALVIDKIGAELHSQYEQKIIFAICHESIECWLLPLVYKDDSRLKTFNCCKTINKELLKSDYSIDCNGKQTKYHERIFKENKDKIKNRNLIENISLHNNSFNQFIQRLATI